MTLVRFGPDEYTLKSTWKSSIEIAEKVSDPLKMAFDLVEGKLELELEQIVCIIWIGLKAAGEEFTYDEVGELVHKHGFINYTKPVGMYLIDMASQGSEEKEDGPKKKAKKPRPGKS